MLRREMEGKGRVNEVLRQEKKFLINLPQVYQLSHALSQVMMEDEHNHGDGYLIRSLYFDTLDDKDFHEKEDGVEVQRKIRLRCYGSDSPFAMLEMKQKQGANQKKRSLRMERQDAERLASGDMNVLLTYKEPFAAECYALMQMLCYRPKAVVEYRRRAFIAKENKIRVTFDHHIIATESCFQLFSPALLQNCVLNPYLAVLEVKYNGFLLSYIKDMLKGCDEIETSVGKYSLSRTISKHVVF